MSILGTIKEAFMDGWNKSTQRDNPEEWTVEELSEWILTLSQPIQEVFADMIESGDYTDDELIEEFRSIRVKYIEHTRIKPMSVVNGIYDMIAYSQQTKAEMHRGDAMENLANLDMDKFGK